METWVTCQCHKARATSCTLFSQPHRPFPSQTHPQRKSAVLLPGEIRGCALSIPPSHAPEGRSCSSSGSGEGCIFSPVPGHSVSVLGATCKPAGICAPDLSVHVSCMGHHTTGRKVHVGALEVFHKNKVQTSATRYKSLTGTWPDSYEHTNGNTCVLAIPEVDGSCFVRGTELCTSIVTRLLTWEQAPLEDGGLFTSSARAFLAIQNFSLVLQVSFALCWPPVWLAVAVSERIGFQISHAKPFPPRC